MQANNKKNKKNSKPKPKLRERMFGQGVDIVTGPGAQVVFGASALHPGVVALGAGKLELNNAQYDKYREIINSYKR
jgi:hypothetical protein